MSKQGSKEHREKMRLIAKELRKNGKCVRKDFRQTEETKKQISEKVKKNWLNLDIDNKNRINSQIKKTWSDPEKRKEQSEKLKKVWQNTEYKNKRYPDITIKFWKYVDKIEEDRCWNWKGWKDANGYGVMRNGKKHHIRAHRCSWIIHFGEIENNLLVCHKCDNPSCVNPNHLFLGTSKDNVDDSIRKGRFTQGEKNGNSKLTAEQVKEIRHIFNNQKTTYAELGRKYRVNENTISNIIKRKAWKSVL